ncbi:helix-turn-helix domain-containing protein [Streptomyces sp. PT12]|uniref:helix-turn-helix domain-containing protein n=1 Tax=Streptomyces sp. PT12 TaxID=1510197 RepID=UPI0015EF57AE|nr:helix-turn-helix domain-containing protein [Streptomyces sp. PT12]
MDASPNGELGARLRAARALVTPADVGLAGGRRRRAARLRREEVAALAGVSVAWYTWLEQGRVTTSRQVIDAVCRALRMGPAAHRYALSLAGFSPEASLGDGAAVGQGTRALIDGWPHTAAVVTDGRFDVLASNAAHRQLWGDPDALPPPRRNVLLHLASSPALWNAEALLRGLYEQFRAVTGQVPDDARAAEIVHALTEERPDVVHWWRCRAVEDFRPTTVAVG